MTADSKRLKLLLKDCTRGFYQQMYFWGQDVVHPSGNQLVKYGFEKSPSQGLKGTSCYTLHCESETVELYGSCAAYYSENSKVVFLRQRNRFYRWISEQKLIAGCWNQSDLEKNDAGEMFVSLVPFLEWWVNYERWILNNHGKDYREQCHRNWSKMNNKLTWLDPQSAIKWLKEFIELKERHVRPKQYA